MAWCVYSDLQCLCFAFRSFGKSNGIWTDSVASNANVTVLHQEVCNWFVFADTFVASLWKGRAKEGRGLAFCKLTISSAHHTHTLPHTRSHTHFFDLDTRDPICPTYRSLHSVKYYYQLSSSNQINVTEWKKGKIRWWCNSM